MLASDWIILAQDRGAGGRGGPDHGGSHSHEAAQAGRGPGALPGWRMISDPHHQGEMLIVFTHSYHTSQYTNIHMIKFNFQTMESTLSMKFV